MLDEAHYVLSTHEKFRGSSVSYLLETNALTLSLVAGPCFRKLGALRVEFPQRPIMALTASVTPQDIKDLIKLFGLRDPVRLVAHSFDRPNIDYCVEQRESPRDRIERVCEIVAQNPIGAFIIYASTAKSCRAIAKVLANDARRVEVYHGVSPRTAAFIGVMLMTGSSTENWKRRKIQAGGGLELKIHRHHGCDERVSEYSCLGAGTSLRD